MHKFGSSGLVTGYIKQLLASFNLPTTRIYTQEHAQYFEEHRKESPYILESFDSFANVPGVNPNALVNPSAQQVTGTSIVPYLKEGRVQYYLGGYYTSDNNFVPGKWQEMTLNVNDLSGGQWITYDRGTAYRNRTKKLQLKNNIYDSYTHEYLGEYLRFLRDYDHIDLMPLYNCFSNRQCLTTTSFDVSLFEGASSFGRFNVADTNYKIYIVPVKLFKSYTIAIDSAQPIEMCCGFYTTKLETDWPKVAKDFMVKTYIRQSTTRFNQPFLYTALQDIAPDVLPEFPTSEDIKNHLEARQFLSEIAPYESTLKLFIKVPKDVSSSITILEGDYVNWNDFVAQVTTAEDASVYSRSKLNVLYNRTILPNEAIFSEDIPELITPLHLLKLNTGSHIPFSDRLLEYLLDGCITGGDNEVRENVLMAQTLASWRYPGGTIPGDYYVLKTVNSQIHIIYTDRAQCQIGDRYVKSLVHNKGSVPSGCAEGFCQHINLVTGTTEDVDEGPFAKWRPTATDVIATSKLVKAAVPSFQYNLVNGVWNPMLRKLFYRNLSTQQAKAGHIINDVLGYVDKDVESTFFAKHQSSPTLIETKTMLNFDTWEDIVE